MAYTYQTEDGDLLRVTACTGHGHPGHVQFSIQNGDRLTVACVPAADASEVTEQITGYAQLAERGYIQ